MVAIVRFTESAHTKLAFDEVNEKKVKVAENVLEGRIIEGKFALITNFTLIR